MKIYLIPKLNFKKNLVFVEGVNTVKKAIKPTQESPDGGFANITVGLHRSNVALVSPKTGGATRVKFENKDGKLVRVATKCGSTL